MPAAAIASHARVKPSLPRPWRWRWTARWRRSCATSPRWPAYRRAPCSSISPTPPSSMSPCSAACSPPCVGEAPDPGAALAARRAHRHDHQPVRERYERLLPMWTFVETLQRRSSEAARQVVQMYTANRDAARALVRPRADGACRRETRERTLNALAMALAPESWVVLRQRLGLTVEQARDELALRRPGRLHRRRGPPLEAARRASSSRARSRKPSSREMGDGVPDIVEVGAGGARPLAHQLTRPRRAAACRRTGDALRSAR